MNADAATLLTMFIYMRDGVRRAMSERLRVVPLWLLDAMGWRWQRITTPAIRILQHLAAGTYRPRPSRAQAASTPPASPSTPPGAGEPRTPRKPEPEQFRHPHWLFRQLPVGWSFTTNASFGTI